MESICLHINESDMRGSARATFYPLTVVTLCNIHTPCAGAGQIQIADEDEEDDAADGSRKWKINFEWGI